MDTMQAYQYRFIPLRGSEQATAFRPLPRELVTLAQVASGTGYHKIADAVDGSITTGAAQWKRVLDMMFTPLDSLMAVVAFALLSPVLFPQFFGGVPALSRAFASLTIAGISPVFIGVGPMAFSRFGTKFYPVGVRVAPISRMNFIKMGIPVFQDTRLLSFAVFQIPSAVFLALTYLAGGLKSIARSPVSMKILISGWLGSPADRAHFHSSFNPANFLATFLLICCLALLAGVEKPISGLLASIKKFSGGRIFFPAFVAVLVSICPDWAWVRNIVGVPFGIYARFADGMQPILASIITMKELSRCGVLAATKRAAFLGYNGVHGKPPCRFVITPEGVRAPLWHCFLTPSVYHNTACISTQEVCFA